MKMRIFLILFILFLTSGCAIEYNVDITNKSNIVETLNGEIKSSTYTTEVFDAIYNAYRSEDVLQNYYVERKDVNGKKTVEIMQVFNNMYDYSIEAALPIYYGSEIEYDTEGNIATVNINVDLELCDYTSLWLPKYDEFIISFTANNVIESNADEIDDNKYIWILDKGDTTTEIVFSYYISETDIYEDTETDEDDSDNQSVLGNKGYLALIILGIVAVVALIAFAIHNKINK